MKDSANKTAHRHNTFAVRMINRMDAQTDWRQVLEHLNVIIAGLILLVEILFLLLLWTGDLLNTSLPTYLLSYIVAPTVADGAALLVGQLIWRKYPRNDKVLNAIPVYTLVVFATTIATAHNVFASTLVFFVIPVVVSTLFMDFALTGRTTLLSMVGMFVALVARAHASDRLIEDLYFWEEAVLGYITVLSTTVIAMVLIRILRLKNEELLAAKAEAEKASKAKSEFLANMSHEIRTPINSIMGLNEMVIRESNQPAVQELASDIKASSDTLLSLVNDILDISKIEAGKMELMPVEYSLVTMLRNQQNMFIGRAAGKKLELKTEIDETLPSGYFGDDVCINRILMNLISNAVKYTEEGTVTLSLQGRRKEDDPSTEVLTFSVKDTGQGIKEEDLSRLTEQYERIDLKHNRSVEGTGLGLSIVSALLMIMGSCLEIESVYGEGSRFFFTLEQPVRDEKPLGEALLEAKKTEKEKSGGEPLGTLRAPHAKVLVVDDNAMNRKVFCLLLRSTEIQVTVADSGQQCLDLIKDHHFDLIFMDHMMPEMDGLETFRKMQEMGKTGRPHAPVVMLTANAVQGAEQAFLAEGFNGYLTKPVIPADLEKALRYHLPSFLIER